MTIFEINVFDENYAAYIRSRKLRDFLLEEGYRVFYSEANFQGEDKSVLNITQSDNLFSYFWATVQRSYYTLRLPYQVLFLHQLSPLTVPLMVIAKIRGRKIILDWDDLASGVQKNKSRTLLAKFCEAPFFIKMADLITSHNPNLINYAKKLGGKKVAYVPQGVETKIFDSSRYKKEPDKLKNALGLSEKKILIFVACFNTGGVRDLDIILEAVREVEEKRIDVLLLIIGGGSLLEEYKGKAKKMEIKNIKFLGKIPHKEVAKFLSLADIGLVFMRDNIGNRMKMSFKTLEYLSMPIRVVGHLAGATKEMVGKFCNLSVANSDSLTQKILDSLIHNAKAELSQSRNYVVTNHDWQVVRKHFLEALKALR